MALDDLKQQLTDLNGRAATLASEKDALMKELARQEQKHEEAIKRLQALGYEDVEDMTPDELNALSKKLTAEAEKKLGAVGTAMDQAEAMMAKYRQLQS